MKLKVDEIKSDFGFEETVVGQDGKARLFDDEYKDNWPSLWSILDRFPAFLPVQVPAGILLLETLKINFNLFKFYIATNHG